MKKVAIGVDIGGTNTAIGVVDVAGNVMVKDNIATPSHGDIDKYISDLAEAINELINNSELRQKLSGNARNSILDYKQEVIWDLLLKEYQSLDE